jgi:hypothetical protein
LLPLIKTLAFAGVVVILTRSFEPETIVAQLEITSTSAKVKNKVDFFIMNSL